MSDRSLIKVNSTPYLSVLKMQFAAHKTPPKPSPHVCKASRMDLSLTQSPVCAVPSFAFSHQKKIKRKGVKKNQTVKENINQIETPLNATLGFFWDFWGNFFLVLQPFFFSNKDEDSVKSAKLEAQFVEFRKYPHSTGM